MLKINKKISYNDEEYYIYKINKTFIWAGKFPTEDVYKVYNSMKPKRINECMKHFEAIKIKDTNVLFKLNDDKKVEMKTCCIKTLKEMKKNKGTHFCKCGQKINMIAKKDNELIFSLNYKALKYNFNNEKIDLIKVFGR